MSRASGQLTEEQVAALDRIIEGWDVIRDGPAPPLRDLRRLATNGDAPTAPGRQIVPQVLSTVQPTRTRWAWEGRVPIGGVTLLPGRQGLGKSTLLASIAAELTRGRLPGDLAGKPTTVLVASYEDPVESVQVPRAIAADADTDLLVALDLLEDGRPDLLSLPGDLELIADAARTYQAGALLIDPLMAAVAGGIDSHRDQDVRRMMAPLAQLAEDADLAVITVLHLRKGAATEALDRVSGSVAFTAAARSVLAFGRRDDDDEDDDSGRVLAHAKSNLGPLAPSLAYRIESATVHHDGLDIPTSRIVCEGEIDVQAGELLSPVPEDRSDAEIAAEWLADHLGNGEWHPTAEVREAAKAADIATRTLQRAAHRLAVEMDRFAPEGVGGRGSAVGHWRLPVAAPPSTAPTGATTPGAATNRLGNGESGTPEQLPRQDTLSGATNPSEALCRYPAHRQSYYRSEAGKKLCAVCHPPAGGAA